jgi:NADPH2:quinone reductase
MKAIQISRYGGPEVLGVKDVPKPSPETGHVLVKVAAAGVNFIDIYQRRGLYQVALPCILGMEGSGIVEEIGPGVNGFSKGEKVAFVNALGAYAEYAVIPAAKLVHLPGEIDLPSAAASMLQGITAHYLTHSTYTLKSGDACLIHAAAGGVGLLLIQMAKNSGARVFGTVSTIEKARLAQEAGADHVIIYTKTDFVEEVRQLTDGKGLNVVYDSVGESTFERGLDCLCPRGYMVLFGQSSGPVPNIDPQILNKKGSLFLTRPSIGHYIADRQSLDLRAEEVLGWVASGRIKLHIGRTFSLEDAAESHHSLESRNSTGKLLLML